MPIRDGSTKPLANVAAAPIGVIGGNRATLGGIVGPGLLLLLGTLGFFANALRSGYGYDALEYLVIGRSITDGYPFLHFVPSKSFGLYMLIAGLMSSGLAFDHVSLAVVITAIYVLVVTTTFAACRLTFGFNVALFASLVVSLASVFMELNYLEPEGFVYVFGVVGFLLVVRGTQSSSLRHLYAAGVVLSFGAYFKSVAGLYAASALAGVLVYGHLRKSPARVTAGRVGSVVVGFLAGSSVPAAYFWATHQLDDYWRWTVYFPLVLYPANTYYLDKLWTKLLWFCVLLVVTVLVSVRPSMRRLVYGDWRVLLVLCFGVIPLVSLLKTQASHYYFPGAAFLSIFVAVVGARTLEGNKAAARRGRWLTATVGLLGMLVGLGVALYRPTAIWLGLDWVAWAVLSPA